MKFRDNREKEEKKIELEVTDEWEKNLKLITARYEDDLKKKKDKSNERVGHPPLLSVMNGRIPNGALLHL